MAKSRPVKTAAQAQTNWANAMSAPTTAQKFTQGVQGVTQSPNAAAASPQAIQKYANSTAQAVASGRLAAGNQAVTLQQWQQAAAAGAASLASGASKGKAKYGVKAQQLQGAWQAARDAANAIPSDGTVATAVAKVQAAITAMKAAVGKPTN